MTNYEKRGYLLENFRLFHLRTQGDSPVNYHYHEFCKVVLLVSGTGSYTVGDRRYLLQPGDAVLVGSRMVHKPEIDSGCVYERIIIYISPDYLKMQSTADCDLLEVFSGQRGHVIRDCKRLFTLASELERELSGTGYGRELLSGAALLRLLVRMGREQRREDLEPPKPVDPTNPRVLGLMRYMEEHLAEDLDVETIAEQFYVSKYHMMRQFRRETGFTVHAYLQQRRLLHARDLMEKGMRATEACYRSGFRSYSSFTRAYGSFFGTTPTGRAGAGEQEEDYE